MNQTDAQDKALLAAEAFSSSSGRSIVGSRQLEGAPFPFRLGLASVRTVGKLELR